jgi:hypothetical protein
VFVNLTPHAVAVHRSDGTVIELPPSGMVARCATTDEVVDRIDGVEVHAMTLGDLTDLPDSQEGVYYVTSLIAAQAARRAGRTDVYAPGPAIRDPDGRVGGCRGGARPRARDPGVGGGGR